MKCTLSFTPDCSGNAKSSAICFQQGAAGKDGALGSSSPGAASARSPSVHCGHTDGQGEGSQHKMGFFGEVLFCSSSIQMLQRGGFTSKMPTEGCVSPSALQPLKCCSHKGQVASKQSSQALLPSGMIPLLKIKECTFPGMQHIHCSR